MQSEPTPHACLNAPAVAKLLAEIGQRLSLAGENPYKARSCPRPDVTHGAARGCGRIRPASGNPRSWRSARQNHQAPASARDDFEARRYAGRASSERPRLISDPGTPAE